MVFSKEINLQENIGEVIIKNILKKEQKSKKKKVGEDIELSPKQSEFIIKPKSHEDLEVEIQSKRVLMVLDEAIFKLHIAACLGLLIEHDGILLKNYLPEEEVEFILDTCSKCIDTELVDYDNVISIGGRSNPKFFQQSLLSRDNRVDVNVAQSIEIISKCKELKQSIGLLLHHKNSLAEKFLEAIHRLRMTVAKKLSITASEERKRERELRIAWKENAEAKVIIALIQEKLDKQTKELEVELNAKNELIKSYINKIQNTTDKFQWDIKKRITESEKVMVQNSQLSEERQIALAQEVKDRAQEYQALVETHLTSEKILRAKRFKVEAQLASWLAKYDQDIGERQAELEELNRLYNEEMEELNILHKKFDEQEEDYIVLMAERDEYEAGINNQKAFAFLQNRSARRIQSYWRAYRERKMLRKKGKKGKKKKKSAGESGEEGVSSAGTMKGKTDPNAELTDAVKKNATDEAVPI